MLIRPDGEDLNPMNDPHEIASWPRGQAGPHSGQTAGQPTSFYDLEARNGLLQAPEKNGLLQAPEKEVAFYDIRQHGRPRAGPS
jgi:hypothetical protein